MNNEKLIILNKDEVTLEGRPTALKRSFENIIQNGLIYGNKVFVNIQKGNNRVLITIEDDSSLAISSALSMRTPKFKIQASSPSLIFLPFPISMAISVYFLNDYLIDLYGINGAAISTLIVLIFFTILKVLYINYKLKIQPYNYNTIKIIAGSK